MAGCCKSLLVALNSLVILVGLGVVGIGIYLAVERSNNDNVFGPDTPEWIAYAAIGLGALIALLALIGCCITIAENKCLLGLYGFLQLLVGVALIVAGAFILTYTSYLKDISENPITDLNSGLGDTRQYLSDYLLGLYNHCCTALSPAPEQCPNVQPVGEDSQLQYCFFDQGAFDAGNTASDDVCGQVESGGNLDWCPATADSTGAGLNEFQTAAYNYVKDYIWPSGVALVAFGAVLFLACIGSCHLACRSKPEYKRNQFADAPPTRGPGIQINQRGMTMA